VAKRKQAAIKTCTFGDAYESRRGGHLPDAGLQAARRFRPEITREVALTAAAGNLGGGPTTSLRFRNCSRQGHAAL